MPDVFSAKITDASSDARIRYNSFDSQIANAINDIKIRDLKYHALVHEDDLPGDLIVFDSGYYIYNDAQRSILRSDQ